MAPLTTDSRRAPRIAAVLFVATGATALVSEQAFEKMLETLLGTSTWAGAAVLSIYFAGLTIGGWAYRFWRRTRLAPLRTYAVLEVGVGVWALVLFATFGHLITFFVPFLRRGMSSFAMLQTFRMAVAAAWILPPTILMGSTFPAMVDALREQFDAPRRAITSFYALNLFGAMCGAALGPYLLFARFGVSGALLAAGAVDILVGISAASLAARVTPVPTSGEADQIETGRLVQRAALVTVSCVSGALFFALEVVWIHLIAAVCGNSVYAFAAMLTMVLAGLFVGGVAAATIVPEELHVSASIPAIGAIAGSVLVALQQAAWPHVPHLFTVWGRGIQSFWAGEGLRSLVAALLLVPVSAVLGSIFPLLFRLREFPAREQGRTAGAMVAANAIGCCAGAPIAAFILIPGIGSEASLLAIALTYSIAGFLALLFVASTRIRVAGLAGAAAAFLICGLLPAWDRLALTSGEHVYFRPMFVQRGSVPLFFHEDSAGGITTVVQDPDTRVRTLLTNGKFQGDDFGERTAQFSFALIPALLVQHLDDALVIGIGTGQSAGVLQQMGFRNVDVAEIAPGILIAARDYFGHVNGGVLQRPNVSVFIEDGRNLLLLREKKYDLIEMEITSIWFAGATNLYSRDFYQVAASRLKPDGVLQQWMQLHHSSPRTLVAALLTLRSVFPYVSFWVVGGQGVAVGSMHPQVLQPAGVSAAMRFAKDNLQVTGGAAFICAVLQNRVFSADDSTRMAQRVRGVVINTDRNRWLEYDSPRYNLVRVDLAAVNLQMLRQFSRPLPMLVANGARELLDQACDHERAGETRSR